MYSVDVSFNIDPRRGDDSQSAGRSQPVVDSRSANTSM